MKLELYGVGKDNASLETKTLVWEVIPEGLNDEFLMESMKRLGVTLEIRVLGLNGIWVKGELKIKPTDS